MILNVYKSSTAVFNHLGINKFRIFVYKMLINPRYKHVVTVIVILNSSLLWVPVSPPELHNECSDHAFFYIWQWDDRYFEIAPLMGLFMIFPLLYIVEVLHYHWVCL